MLADWHIIIRRLYCGWQKESYHSRWLHLTFLPLSHIVNNCKHLQDEETVALEHLGTQLGITVKLTLKFHAKLAGEGVEYSWAHSKSFYRCLPLSENKGWEQFKRGFEIAPALSANKRENWKVCSKSKGILFIIWSIRNSRVLMLGARMLTTVKSRSSKNVSTQIYWMADTGIQRAPACPWPQSGFCSFRVERINHIEGRRRMIVIFMK